MDTKIDGSILSINLYDLVAGLPKEHRDKLIDALACTDQVIDEVMNQVLDGYTTGGSHAGRGFGGNPDATRGIDGARMRIAKASSAVAAEEIERLREQIIREKELGQKGWDEYHKAIGSYR
jgi:hypothetical protein